MSSRFFYFLYLLIFGLDLVVGISTGLLWLFLYSRVGWVLCSLFLGLDRFIGGCFQNLLKKENAPKERGVAACDVINIYIIVVSNICDD